MYSKKLGSGKQFVIDASAPVVKAIRLETDGDILRLRLPGPLGKVVELPDERFFIEYGSEGLASIAVVDARTKTITEHLDGGDSALKLLDVTKDSSVALVANAPLKDFSAFSFVERWDLKTRTSTGYCAALDENENPGLILSGKLTQTGARLSVMFDGEVDPVTVQLDDKFKQTRIRRPQQKQPKTETSPISMKPSLRPYGLGGGIWKEHNPKPRDYEKGVPIDPANPAGNLSLQDCQKLCVQPCWNIKINFDDYAFVAKHTAWHAQACRTVSDLLTTLFPSLTYTHFWRGEPFVAPALTPKPFEKKRFAELLPNTLFFDFGEDYAWLLSRNGTPDAASYDTSIFIFSSLVEICLAPAAIQAPALVKCLAECLKGLDYASCRVRTGLSGWLSIEALRHPAFSTIQKTLAALEQGCPGLGEEVALFLGPRRLSTTRGKKLLDNLPAGVVPEKISEAHALITPETPPSPLPDGRFESSATAKALSLLAGEWVKKLGPTGKERDDMLKELKKMPKLKVEKPLR